MPTQELTAQPAEASDMEAFPFTDADAPADAPEQENDTLLRDDADTFTPDTADKVDWVLSKVADARARAARIRDNAERMAKEQDAAADFLLLRYGPALQAFARQELDGGRKKSLRLFHGVIGYRTRPAAVVITNEPEARAWAEANCPTALRVDRAALAARLLETGEMVEGTQFTPPAEMFYVK